MRRILKIESNKLPKEKRIEIGDLVAKLKFDARVQTFRFNVPVGSGFIADIATIIVEHAVSQKDNLGIKYSNTNKTLEASDCLSLPYIYDILQSSRVLFSCLCGAISDMAERFI